MRVFLAPCRYIHKRVLTWQQESYYVYRPGSKNQHEKADTDEDCACKCLRTPNCKAFQARADAGSTSHFEALCSTQFLEFGAQFSICDGAKFDADLIESRASNSPKRRPPTALNGACFVAPASYERSADGAALLLQFTLTNVAEVAVELGGLGFALPEAPGHPPKGIETTVWSDPHVGGDYGPSC